MTPLPRLEPYRSPLARPQWSDLLVLPVLLRLRRAHKEWHTRLASRDRFLRSRTPAEHQEIWAASAWRELERQISPVLAKHFQLPTDLLHPNDPLDSIFESDDSIDNVYRMELEIERLYPETSSRAFERHWSSTYSNLDYAQFLGEIAKAGTCGSRAE